VHRFAPEISRHLKTLAPMSKQLQKYMQNQHQYVRYIENKKI